MKKYVKPETKTYTIRIEGLLNPNSCKPGWGPDKDDNGSRDGHDMPPGQRKSVIYNNIDNDDYEIY